VPLDPCYNIIDQKNKLIQVTKSEKTEGGETVAPNLTWAVKPTDDEVEELAFQLKRDERELTQPTYKRRARTEDVYKMSSSVRIPTKAKTDVMMTSMKRHNRAVYVREPKVTSKTDVAEARHRVIESVSGRDQGLGVHKRTRLQKISLY
jgi:hypothetical protein